KLMEATDEPSMKVRIGLWISDYIARCRALMPRYRHVVYFPVLDQIPFTEEPGRATADTRKLMDTFIHHFLRESLDRDLLCSSTGMYETDPAKRIEGFRY